ncbi:MAG: hypothetical protein ACYDHG_08370 [Desulfomonilaceae bacterium]
MPPSEKCVGVAQSDMVVACGWPISGAQGAVGLNYGQEAGNSKISTKRVY